MEASRSPTGASSGRRLLPLNPMKTMKKEEDKIFLIVPSSVSREVMYMDYVTWSELIKLLMEIATLAFVVMSYLQNKKR